MVPQQLLVFNEFLLPSFALIGGRSYAFRPFLSKFTVFQKTVKESFFLKEPFFFYDLCDMVC